mmetsp:Transcript_3135/g.11225  ORF Transcript_3135/g.11225 Transcript_3135/m.11225 type:complete len:483 (-) Transcript_3135:560-2008(-)
MARRKFMPLPRSMCSRDHTPVASSGSSASPECGRSSTAVPSTSSGEPQRSSKLATSHSNVANVASVNNSSTTAATSSLAMSSKNTGRCVGVGGFGTAQPGRNENSVAGSAPTAGRSPSAAGAPTERDRRRLISGGTPSVRLESGVAPAGPPAPPTLLGDSAASSVGLPPPPPMLPLRELRAAAPPTTECRLPVERGSSSREDAERVDAARRFFSCVRDTSEMLPRRVCCAAGAVSAPATESAYGDVLPASPDPPDPGDAGSSPKNEPPPLMPRGMRRARDSSRRPPMEKPADASQSRPSPSCSGPLVSSMCKYESRSCIVVSFSRSSDCAQRSMPRATSSGTYCRTTRSTRRALFRPAPALPPSSAIVLREVPTPDSSSCDVPLTRRPIAARRLRISFSSMKCCRKSTRRERSSESVMCTASISTARCSPTPHSASLPVTASSAASSTRSHTTRTSARQKTCRRGMPIHNPEASTTSAVGCR